jgi:hypothetical protein
MAQTQDVRTKAGAKIEAATRWGVYNRVGTCIAIVTNRKHANLLVAAPELLRLAEDVRERSKWADWGGQEGNERGDITITGRFVDEVDDVNALAKGNLKMVQQRKMALHGAVNLILESPQPLANVT